MALLPPIFQQNNQYSARVTRQLVDEIGTEGVVGAGDFAVTERAAGASMSVDIAAGRAFIAGTDQANQGTYLCISESVENVVVEPADPSLGRIDLVVAQVRDPNAGGVAGDDWAFVVIEGTPDAAPVAPALPDSAIPLAEVEVNAAVTSILDADITDLRTFSSTPVRADLDDLRDVDVPSPSAGDVLAFDGAEWKAEGLGFRYAGTRYYTSSGTFEKADPLGTGDIGLRAIKVRLVGGGGGSGRANQGTGAAGGGGGGYAESFITDLTSLTSSETVTVGAGGPGSTTSGVDGGDGGSTSFGALVSATGGRGGSSGVASDGDFNRGGSGGSGTAGDLLIDGDGGGAGANDQRQSGKGGSSMLGGGGRGNARTALAGASQAGGNYGGGAGGGVQSTSGNQSGREGGDGIVIVDCFV